MNRNFQIIASAAAASVLALSALAQNTASSTTERTTEYSRDGVRKLQRIDRLNGAAKVSDIIGMAVQDQKDEKLGKVDDLAIDLESGRILQVIISTRGFIANTMTAVPPGILHHDVEKKILHLDADKAKLMAAPELDIAKWAELSDTNHLFAVYHYYGEDAALGYVRSGEVPSELPGSKFMIPSARLIQAQQASKILRLPVQNLQSEKLGEVESLVLDITSGRVVAVVISSGAFLGMDNERSPVPPTALRLTTDRAGLQLDATREFLSNAPHFKSDQWPDFTQATYSDSIYRAYHVAPYFSTNLTGQAELITRGIRERVVTPPDSASAADSPEVK